MKTLQWGCHHVRMQPTRLSQCALEVGCPPGHLSVHPKVGLSYPLNLTQCAFHLVSMQLVKYQLIGHRSESESWMGTKSVAYVPFFVCAAVLAGYRGRSR